MKKSDEKKFTTENGENPVKKSGFKKLAEATIGKAIAKYTRPMVEKIPQGVLQFMGDLGVDNVLDVATIGLVSLLPEGSKAADQAGDFLNEFTSELTSAIKNATGKENTKKESPNDPKATESTTMAILRILLSPELSDYSEMFLNTMNKVMEEKKSDVNFRKNFFISINKLSDKELLMLFDHLTELTENGKQQEIDVLLSLLIKEEPPKKEERSALEAYKESVKPVIKEISNDISCSATSLLEKLKKMDKDFAGSLKKSEDDPGFIKGVFGRMLEIISNLKFWGKPENDPGFIKGLFGSILEKTKKLKFWGK